jgi:hypothetical protein
MKKVHARANGDQVGGDIQSIRDDEDDEENAQEISWTAAISGKVIKAVQMKTRPNRAPACEYVAIPEGSSSDAPVTNPGPMALKYWRQIGPLDSESRSNSDWCLDEGAGSTLFFRELDLRLG